MDKLVPSLSLILSTSVADVIMLLSALAWPDSGHWAEAHLGLGWGSEPTLKAASQQ